MMLLCVLLWMQTGCRPEAAQPTPIDAATLTYDKLEWTEVSAAYQRALEDPVFAGQLLAARLDQLSLASRYARGVLSLNQSTPEQALELFLGLDPQSMPVAFLYIPFRLHEELRPEADNPFWPALRRNIDETGVAPLVRARVLIMDGDLLRGLEAYGRSDPAQWTQMDARLFANLAQHAGWGSECRRLLQAALRGGRVPPPLRDDLLRILYPVEESFGAEGSLELLRERLASNPEMATAVVGASRSLLDLQRLFLARDYQAVQSRCIDLDPVGQADRTVLLAFLASVSLNDRPEAARWSSELIRRYPNGEMTEWIQAIRKDME